MPNGRSLDHEQYQFKLEWLGRLRAHLDSACDANAPLLVCGDFNIAPDDRDVWDPKAVHGATHVSEPERAALGELLSWGLVDVFRRPEHVAGIVTDCIRFKLPALWLQEGVVDQAAAERAVQAGIFTVMDRCLFKVRAALRES